MSGPVILCFWSKHVSSSIEILKLLSEFEGVTNICMDKRYNRQDFPNVLSVPQVWINDKKFVGNQCMKVIKSQDNNNTAGLREEFEEENYGSRQPGDFDTSEPKRRETKEQKINKTTLLGGNKNESLKNRAARLRQAAAGTLVQD